MVQLGLNPWLPKGFPFLISQHTHLGHSGSPFPKKEKDPGHPALAVEDWHLPGPPEHRRDMWPWAALEGPEGPVTQPLPSPVFSR